MTDQVEEPAALQRWTARVASDEAHELGEGPVWSPVHHRLLWVDIRSGAVFGGKVSDDGTVTVISRESFGETVGAVAVAEDGRLLVAGRHGLIECGADGDHRRGPNLLDDPGRRLNDGKADPAGRYLVGSLRLDGDSSTEELWLVDHDGAVRVLDDDLTLSNGLGWSADGTRMYSVDTGRRTVFVRDYDPATGETGPRSVAFEIADGFPDGMCLDSEDQLWIAIWGHGEVRRYTPDGTLTGIVEVAAPQTSSVAFAGRNLETLVITTATQDLSEDDLARSPLSGRLFSVRPGVRGRPEPLWAGR